jgi:NADH-quinone oxidoreductase subunit C
MVVDRSLIPEILQVLRNEEQFDYCVDITAVHYPKREKQFDVVWVLYSFPRNERIRVKTLIAEDESLPSSVPLWATTNWLEREVFDMFGVTFRGHPDLRRILMWETYAEGHPLRKDFPLRGRFSRAEQVRQALNANPEAHYSMEELSIAEAYDELPPDMRERLRRGERDKIPNSE